VILNLKWIFSFSGYVQSGLVSGRYKGETPMNRVAITKKINNVCYNASCPGPNKEEVDNNDNGKEEKQDNGEEGNGNK
jgi:hypothetical protein